MYCTVLHNSFSIQRNSHVINVPAQNLVTTQALSQGRPSLSWEYSVKVTNQARKSDFRVEKLHASRLSGHFETINELKQQVCDGLKGLVESPLKTIGYIEPGHGAKGKLSTETSPICMSCTQGREVKFYYGAT